MFQYMPPRGGQPQFSALGEQAVLFQYMPPRGGQLSNLGGYYVYLQFQYMPPRGGQQKTQAEIDQMKSVSIHAPTRGATFFPLFVVA